MPIIFEDKGAVDLRILWDYWTYSRVFSDQILRKFCILSENTWKETNFYQPCSKKLKLFFPHTFMSSTFPYLKYS